MKKNSQFAPDNFSGFDHGLLDSVLALMVMDDEFVRENQDRLKPELFVDSIRTQLANAALSFFREQGHVAGNLFYDFLDKIATEENLPEARIKLLKDKAVNVMQSSPNAKYVSERLEKFFDFQKVKILKYELERATEEGDVEGAIEAVKRAQVSLEEGGETLNRHNVAPYVASYPIENKASDAFHAFIASRPEINTAVFHGLAGEIAQDIDPFTEADPVATLSNILVIFGNYIGARAHAIVSSQKHYPRLFIVHIGPTGVGRKGLATEYPRRLIESIDPVYAKERIFTAGLSTGEGLIYQVRDPRTENKIDKDFKKRTGSIKYNEEQVDGGVTDKRLQAIESEFGSLLRKMNRQENILSGTLRSAFDSGSLANLTKSSPYTATDAHISLIGHVTPEELAKNLTDTEKANGLGNRILWLWTERSKLLPEGPNIPNELLGKHKTKLLEAIRFARNITAAVSRDREASNLWNHIYPFLSKERSGLIGSMLSRPETQVLRLSLIYALLDRSPEIRVEHVLAALGLWDYCELTVHKVFKNQIGNPDADRILEALRKNPSGLSRAEISFQLFGRHRTPAQNHAINLLLEEKRISLETVKTDGRSKQLYKIAREKESDLPFSALEIAKQFLGLSPASETENFTSRTGEKSAKSDLSKEINNLAGEKAAKKGRHKIQPKTLSDFCELAIADAKEENANPFIPCIGIIRDGAKDLHIRRIIEEKKDGLSLEFIEQAGVFHYDRNQQTLKEEIWS